MNTTPSSPREQLFEQLVISDVLVYRNVENTPPGVDKTDRYKAGMRIAGILFALALESKSPRRFCIQDLRATLERNGIKSVDIAMDLIEGAFDDLCFAQMRGEKPEVIYCNIHGYEYTDDVRSKVKKALLARSQK